MIPGLTRPIAPHPHPQNQLLRPTLVKAGFYSIKFGAFNDALGYLKAGQVDPLQVLALFPLVIPSSVNTHTLQALRRTLADTYAMDKIDDASTVAVTAGYVCPEPRAEFYRHIDAANVDLKGFSERFYRELCSAELGAVLDTLRFATSLPLDYVGLTMPYPLPGTALLERMGVPAERIGDSTGKLEGI